MISINIKNIFLTTILLFTCTQLQAWDEDSSKKLIEKADAAIGDLDNDFEIQKFLPHGYYSESIINVRNARKEIENEEYDLAFFYASIALIKMETAKVYAEVRKIQQEKLFYERNYYRDTKNKPANQPVKTSGDLNEIIEANLLKKDNIYRIEILDRNLFEKSRLRLSKRGLNKMEKIIRVLEKYDTSKIKIVGHTSFYDYRNFSDSKSKRLKKFLIANNISENRIDSIGAGNKLVMNTAVGYRRIDRIEIIISGIE